MPETALIPVRARHVDGSVFEARALPTPVPGLAIGRDECVSCNCEAYVLMHVRSGTALLSAHSAEAFGGSWGILATVDWTISAAELAEDREAALVMYYLRLRLPDVFMSTEADVDQLVDLNEPIL